jgi:2-oxoglutarate ferredoxin oxidoreductase subunit delta
MPESSEPRESNVASAASLPAGPPPAPAAKKARGTIQLVVNRCKGCGFCIEFCPPKVLAFADMYNAAGYRVPELLHPEGCTGCDLCGLYCPDFAIHGVMFKAGPQKAAAAGGAAGVEESR